MFAFAPIASFKKSNSGIYLVDKRSHFVQKNILKKKKNSEIRRGHSQLNKHIWFLYINTYTRFFSIIVAPILYFKLPGNPARGATSIALRPQSSYIGDIVYFLFVTPYFAPRAIELPRANRSISSFKVLARLVLN